MKTGDWKISSLPVFILYFSLSRRLLCGKAIHEEIGKGSQFLLLRNIDIQLLIIQPVISIDGQIPLFIRIDYKGIRGIFVAVSFKISERR